MMHKKLPKTDEITKKNVEGKVTGLAVGVPFSGVTDKINEIAGKEEARNILASVKDKVNVVHKRIANEIDGVKKRKSKPAEIESPVNEATDVAHKRNTGPR